MNMQEILNAIATLSAAIDPMMRAGLTEEAKEVGKKILELSKSLDK